MKHIGIIAEYNPFHKGHEYQINELRRLFPEKKIVICLSGDYVQRGEPGIFPKALRAQSALCGGADLVIELPFLFSCASSEHFATAGVLSLAASGIVDTLCFGAECNDIETLCFLADFFLEEPNNYTSCLKDNLSSGLSFPKARAAALKNCYPDKDYDDILKYPNNILAIEYIKAIKKYHLDITPFVIKRSHDNHNSLDLDNEICSSTAIRKTIGCLNSPDYNILNDHVPANVLELIKKSPYAKPLLFEDFYPLLQYRILADRSTLINYFEMTEELTNSIYNMTILPPTLEELCDKLSGKHITSARVRRALLNILLSHTKELINEYKFSPVHYIRILGVKEDSTYLIKEINHISSVPVINKTTSASKIMSAEQNSLFSKEIAENMLYRQVFYNKYGIVLPTEYEQSVIII